MRLRSLPSRKPLVFWAAVAVAGRAVLLQQKGRLRYSTLLHQTAVLQLGVFPVRRRQQCLRLCSFCRAVRPLLRVVAKTYTSARDRGWYGLVAQGGGYLLVAEGLIHQ